MARVLMSFEMSYGREKTRKTISIIFRDDAKLWACIQDFCEHNEPPMSRTEFIKFAVREVLRAKPQDSGTGQNEAKAPLNDQRELAQESQKC